MLMLVLLVIANFNANVVCEQLLRVINFEETKFKENLSYCELLPEMQRVRFMRFTNLNNSITICSLN